MRPLRLRTLPKGRMMLSRGGIWYLRVYNHVIEGPGEVPAVKANAEAAAVATWKAPPDVPGRRPRP